MPNPITDFFNSLNGDKKKTEEANLAIKDSIMNGFRKMSQLIFGRDQNGKRSTFSFVVDLFSGFVNVLGNMFKNFFGQSAHPAVKAINQTVDQVTGTINSIVKSPDPIQKLLDLSPQGKLQPGFDLFKLLSGSCDGKSCSNPQSKANKKFRL